MQYNGRHWNQAEGANKVKSLNEEVKSLPVPLLKMDHSVGPVMHASSSFEDFPPPSY